MNAARLPAKPPRRIKLELLASVVVAPQLKTTGLREKTFSVHSDDANSERRVEEIEPLSKIPHNSNFVASSDLEVKVASSRI